MMQQPVLYKYDRTQQLQIISWNINGPGEGKKWSRVKDFFANGCMWDIALLQETKMTEKKLQKHLRPLMEGEAKWMFTSKSHGGLAMFVHPRLEARVVQSGQDSIGWIPPPTSRQRAYGIPPSRQFWFQWMILDTKIGPLGICNLYGPHVGVDGGFCGNGSGRHLMQKYPGS